MSALLYEIRVLFNKRLASLAACRRDACAPRISSSAVVYRSFMTNFVVNVLKHKPEAYLELARSSSPSESIRRHNKSSSLFCRKHEISLRIRKEDAIEVADVNPVEYVEDLSYSLNPVVFFYCHGARQA